MTAWPRMELINIWNAGFILCRQRKLIGCKTLHSLCKKCCSKYCDGTTIIICQVGSKHSNFVVTEYISRQVGRVCFEWEKCWCQLIWSKWALWREIKKTRGTDNQNWTFCIWKVTESISRLHILWFIQCNVSSEVSKWFVSIWREM